MAGENALTDDQQITRSVYDSLRGRYEQNKDSLSIEEKAVLFVAAASDALRNQEKSDQLTGEINQELQARCDEAKAFLNRIESGEPYKGATFWPTFSQILPDRLFDDCFDLEGLENILQQVYILYSRAGVISDRLYGLPAGVDVMTDRPPTTSESDPARYAKLQRLKQLYGEEKGILEAKGISGEELENKAWRLATFRMAVGDKAFEEQGYRH